MLRYLVLILLTLTACAPVVYTPAEVLPEEAQRVIDRATATAAAHASEVARATADAGIVRETSTAAALGTHEALAVEQTRSALRLTEGAATRSAWQTDVWSTPTVAALQTQAVYRAQEFERRQAQAANVAEFWRLVRAVVVVFLGSLALAFCVWVGARAYVQVKAEDRKLKALLAMSTLKLIGPGHWAEVNPERVHEGVHVYELPGGRLDEPPVILPNPEYVTHVEHERRQKVRVFCWWGEKFGFGIRDLGAEGQAVISDPDWRVMVKTLKSLGVLAVKPVNGANTTTWADVWSYHRLTEELATLPLPEALDTVKVAFTVPTQHHDKGQHNTTTQALVNV